MNDRVGFDYSEILYYNYDEGFFTILYSRKSPLPLEKINEIFDLIEECYPNCLFVEDNFSCALGDISLVEYKNTIYKHRPDMLNDIMFRYNVYIEGLDSKLYLIRSEKLGLEFKIYDFERNDDNNNVDDNVLYSIKIYPFAYFDQVEIQGIVYKQNVAAQKNRRILKEFLIEFEKIVGSKPIDIYPYNLENILYEYGVNENAIKFKF